MSIYTVASLSITAMLTRFVLSGMLDNSFTLKVTSQIYIPASFIGQVTHWAR
jgi:hypothetical protein